jgi:hypothetical protein
MQSLPAPQTVRSFMSSKSDGFRLLAVVNARVDWLALFAFRGLPDRGEPFGRRRGSIGVGVHVHVLKASRCRTPESTAPKISNSANLGRFSAQPARRAVDERRVELCGPLGHRDLAPLARDAEPFGP